MPKNRPIDDFNSLFGAPISMKKVKEESKKVKKGEKTAKDRFLVKVDPSKLKEKKKKKAKMKEINANSSHKNSDKERVKKKLDAGEPKPKVESSFKPVLKGTFFPIRLVKIVTRAL